jgi:hypothetical protein
MNIYNQIILYEYKSDKIIEEIIAWNYIAIGDTFAITFITLKSLKGYHTFLVVFKRYIYISVSTLDHVYFNFYSF